MSQFKIGFLFSLLAQEPKITSLQNRATTSVLKIVSLASCGSQLEQKFVEYDPVMLLEWCA